MNQNITNKWTAIGRFVFISFSIYIVLHVFFMSDYSYATSNAGSEFLHLNFICVEVTSLINKLFLHKKFPGFVPTADSYWAYVATFTFFVLAMVIALLWLVAGKRKNIPPAFFEFVFVVARYFVAFELLFYGIEKLDGIQFTISAERLIPSVGSSDPFNLYWISTGASKSYAFFGGLLETAAAILLLFRRTTTLGCLIAIPVLLNVLLINIAFEVVIKLKTFHLLLFSIFILTHDINRLYKFFILKQNTSLSLSRSPLIRGKRIWVQYALKFLLVSYMLFSIVRDEIHYYEQSHYGPYQQLVGIYNVKEFHLVEPQRISYDIDSPKWKNLAISVFGNGVRVQLTNDSIADYDYQVDIPNRIIKFKGWWPDTTTKAKLHYIESKPGEWLFEGIYKTDSVRFSSTKIDIYTLPLLKDRGKIKWTYDSPQ